MSYRYTLPATSTPLSLCGLSQFDLKSQSPPARTLLRNSIIGSTTFFFAVYIPTTPPKAQNPSYHSGAEPWIDDPLLIRRLMNSQVIFGAGMDDSFEKVTFDLRPCRPKRGWVSSGRSGQGFDWPMKPTFLPKSCSQCYKLSVKPRQI